MKTRKYLLVLIIAFLLTGCSPSTVPAHRSPYPEAESHNIDSQAIPSATVPEMHNAQESAETPDLGSLPDDSEPQVTQSLHYEDVLPEDSSPPYSYELPNGFAYATDIIPDVVQDIRYYGTNNFLGVSVDGYLAPVAILANEAAEALRRANDDLMQQGFAIVIFDAYRPQAAVDHFMRWAADENDTIAKDAFYPDLDKSRLIPDGYIARRSGHSRGSTVDVGIIDVLTGSRVDMGTDFDFFGDESHHGTSLISDEQSANRLILKSAMERAGFGAYPKEWWHYTLANEPYPNTYFDFPVS